MSTSSATPRVLGEVHFPGQIISSFSATIDLTKASPSTRFHTKVFLGSSAKVIANIGTKPFEEGYVKGFGADVKWV